MWVKKRKALSLLMEEKCLMEQEMGAIYREVQEMGVLKKVEKIFKLLRMMKESLIIIPRSGIINIKIFWHVPKKTF